MMADDAARIAQLEAENSALRTELQRSNVERDEALEQQTALGALLRVIASSPTDEQRVLDAIVAAAARLTESDGAVLLQVHGDILRGIARYGRSVAALEASRAAGLVLSATSPHSIVGQSLLGRRTVHAPDLAALVGTEYAETRAFSRVSGFRSMVCTPLLRHGEPVGILNMHRFQQRAFTERQIALLEAFADQAVIAIENARLFEALEQRNRDVSEALDRQTALGEVLRVIASTPTDLGRVLQAIVETAARLCEAPSGALLQFRERDQRLAPRANFGFSRARLDREGVDFETAAGVPTRLASAAGRAYLEGRTLHIEDFAEAVRSKYPESSALQARNGVRTVAYVPLLRHGTPLGVLSLQRREVRPFSDQHIVLLETFADQAVIAIENARLIQELERRNAELQESNRQVTEAPNQQTATAEILRAIAASPIAIQPVFDTIVESAARLCDGFLSTVYRYDGELIHLVAYKNLSAQGLGEFLRAYPMPLSRGSLVARTISERRMVHVRDAQTDPSVPELPRHLAREAN
jgi:GAF domain-containing protein